MFSKRIELLSKKILPYKSFADIGCDHGYLMIESLLNNHCEFAYGVDNKKGPLNNALLNLKKYNIDESKYRLDLSSGLQSLTNVECVVIAGMGTDTIKNILNESFDKLSNVQRIIVDSHRNINQLREFMMKINYSIKDEEIIFEDNIYYEIIVFEKSDDEVFYDEISLEFGPVLLKEKNNTFLNKWKQELERLSLIYQNHPSENILKKIELIKRVV